MSSSRTWRQVAFVRTDVSEERIAYIIRVTRISELKTLAETSNWDEILISLARRFFPPWWRRRHVPPKRRLLQEPYGVTSQKTAFFILTAVKIRFYSRFSVQNLPSERLASWESYRMFSLLPDKHWEYLKECYNPFLPCCFQFNMQIVILLLDTIKYNLIKMALN
jgi:hypothetical protein